MGRAKPLRYTLRTFLLCALLLGLVPGLWTPAVPARALAYIDDEPPLTLSDGASAFNQPAPAGQLLSFSRLSISPPIVAGGIPVSVRFTVTNDGAEEEGYDAGVLVDGAVEANVSGSLPPLASQTHKIFVSRSAPGIHVVNVGSLRASFLIRGPDIRVMALDVVPQHVAPGDEFSIFLQVANQGGSPGSYSVPVLIGNNTVETFTGSLPAGKRKAFLLTRSESAPGTYRVTAGGLAGQFTVSAPFLGLVGEHLAAAPAAIVAQDQLGQILKPTGDRIIWSEADGSFVFNLPVALEPDNRLALFRDLVTDVDLQSGQLTIPLPSEAGRGQISLVGNVDGIEGTGDSARVTVKKSDLWAVLGEQEVDLNSFETVFGKVGVGARVNLLSIPRALELQVVTRAFLMPQEAAAIEQFIITNGGVLDIGLAADFAISSSTPAELGPALIDIAFGPEWLIRATGLDDVRVLRFLPGEPVELLGTRCGAIDDGLRYRCGAFSPHGLGTFILARLAHVPPRLEYAGLTLDPAVASPGEAIVVDLQVDNQDDRTVAIYPLLELNKQPDRAGNFLLEPRSGRLVTFVTVRKQEGGYDVLVAGQSSRLEVGIARPTQPSWVSRLQVQPQNVQPGQSTTATVQVQNLGRQSGRFEIPFKINGVVVDVQPVALDPGESQTLALVITPEQLGSYTVEVQALAGSFQVRQTPTPAAFAVTSLEPEETKVSPGISLRVTVLVSNEGEEDGAVSVALSINGEQYQTQEVSLKALSQTPVHFEVVGTIPGIYLLESGGQQARFQVTEGKVPELDLQLRIGGSEFASGSQIVVAADFVNSLTTRVEESVAFQVNGQLIQRRTVTLSPAAIRTETFLFTPTEAGVYEIHIGGEVLAVDVVEPGSLLWLIVLAATLPEFLLGSAAAIIWTWRRRRRTLVV